MWASTSKSARQLLDEVYGKAQLDDFAADRFLDRLTAELERDAEPTPTLDGLTARDELLRGVLAALDAFTQRVTRIRLDHRLAGDTSVASRFRAYIASTVIDHAGDLDALRARVAGIASRVDPAGAAATAEGVIDEVIAALELRAHLWRGVLDLAARLAAAAIGAAAAAARDPMLPDAERLRWTALRRDLELVVEDPVRIARARLGERVKTLVDPDEPPEERPELTRGELIELD